MRLSCLSTCLSVVFAITSGRDQANDQPTSLPLLVRNPWVRCTGFHMKSATISPWGDRILLVLPTLNRVQFNSAQSLSRVRLVATPRIITRQASLSITSSRNLLKLGPSSRWCHPAISSSVVPFSSWPQSLPASGSFPVSQLFAWGGQSIRVSASASVLPMNTQDWSPLGWTGWISLQSKELSRVFSNTTAQKHQFFVTRLSSQSNSHLLVNSPGTPSKPSSSVRHQ